MPKKSSEKIACEQCFVAPFCLSLQDSDNRGVCVHSEHEKPGKMFLENEYLFHAKTPFSNFYMVKQGAFKKLLFTADGREQISAFFLPGEFIGLDSAGYAVYQSSVVAIQEGSIACEISADKWLSFARHNADMQQQLLRAMSEQFHHADFVPRNAHAKEKIAAFLLNISERYHAYNKHAMNQMSLPMSRQDIGNYLGLTIETVSRIFTELKKEGILEAQGKEVIISDSQKLSKTTGF